ncbi:hypothetical protein SLS59_009426 [Nothophoma quercina]|uniref:Uncharacterized protein n=1 Tax=Nothophoma quercina TaxID=749835 RepID=A0ABR3QLS7_9PLEO
MRCPPGVGPGPGPGGEQGDCGPLGCDGYCNTPGGCDPCPKEICGGPQCPIATGCGPKPGPNPKPNTKRPPKCDEDKKTTVTEKLVHCTESIQLEPTTIQSINFTLSTTVTSTCWTPLLATYTGCGILGTSTTTTLSKFTTTSSSEAPMCTRAPLDLNNDEGDNEQPPRTTDGPSCTRAPLSLDDDEGDNEHPTSSEGPSCTRAPLSLDDDEGDNEQSTSSEAPQCTRAPLSLDDDEGNNEMPDEMLSSLSLSFSVTPRPTPSANSSLSFTPTPTSNSSDVTSSVSRVPPPSTLSESFTDFPWGTGIPSGTPVAQCSGCDKEFKRLVQLFCPDGENVDACAKWALTGLCYGSESPDYCKTGSCKPAACPKEKPGNFENGEPAIPWTTTLSLASTTITVTATPTSVSLPIGPTPTCDPGHGVSPDGKWTILVEHEIKERPDNATFTWKLWDENGCYADQGAASNQIHGHNITTDIGTWSRKDYKMGYSLHTNVTESLSTSKSEVEFVISKPVDGCKSDCWTKWKIANPQESKPFQIHSDCAPECGMRKLDTSDISCDDGINKFHDNGVGSVQKRGGYCTFRMPFQPKDDSAPPPLKPFTRDSRWTLEIRQWMEYEKSEIEWSIKDPHGISAGNDLWDTSNANPYSGVVDTRGRDDTPENNIRYKMKLTVDEPRTKEKSTVQIEYLSWDQFDGCSYNTNVVGEMAGCRPIYLTETSDEKQQSSFNGCFGLNPFTNKKTACPKAMLSNAEFTCEMVADSFYPKGAGFERKFKCFWPHDFVDPWDGLPRPDDNQLMLVDERKKKFGEKYRGAYWIASVMGTDGGLNGTVASAGVDGKVNESSWTNV